MRRYALIHVALLSVALLWACERPAATQIVVVVESDLRVPTDVGYVVIVTNDHDGHLVDSIEVSLANDRASPVRSQFPFSFTVVPRGSDDSMPITITLQALTSSSRSLVFERIATTQFAHGRTLLLRMRLAARCITEASTCAAGETCTETGCRSRLVSPDELSEIRPGEEFADAGSADAADVGVSDAGAPGRCQDSYDEVSIGGDVQPFTHSCARMQSGFVFCWGANSRGQLGMAGGGVLRPANVAIGSGVTALAAGSEMTCLIQAGTPMCFGDNAHGQLGAGDTAAHEGPTVVGTTGTFTALSAGRAHACAIDTMGRLFCWGDGAAGQLGNGDTAMQSSPVRVGSAAAWTIVAAGTDHTCGVRAGELHCWGASGRGQLGTGAGDTSSPARVGTSTSWTALAAGDGMTCGIDGGQLFCWGTSTDGALGVGDTSPHPTPTAVSLAGPSAISVGPEHACAIAAGHRLYCWGRNAFGQLGQGVADRMARSAPAEIVVSGVTWRDVSADAEGHTCAVASTGEPWCWGLNVQGQLGIGTVTDVRVPAPLCP